jgi:hypothetical protein
VRLRARAAVALAIAAGCGSKEDKPAPDDAGPVVPAAVAPRVSRPGRAAMAALKKLEDPSAILFFPPGPVADQVFGYLSDLGKQSGVALEIRELDRLLQVEEAKRYRITRDGVIVLVSGERSERVEIHPDGAAAAGDLAALDGSVAAALDKLGRPVRQVALVKHEVADVERYASFEQALAVLDLAVTTVVPGKDVPAGAVAIFLDVGAGPTRPAMESIDRHLAAGGAALVAIEPRPGASLGPLEKRLGLALAEGALADPAAHAALRKDASDNRLVVTSAIGPHASLASLERTARGTGLLFADGGALVERAAPADGAQRVVTVRSMPTAFLDLNGNGVRDGREAARSRPIAAAVSGRFKAIVIADASWLSDEVLRAVPASQLFLAGAVRWLAGEEAMAATAARTPASGDQLTSYPLRTPATASARAPLWTGPPDGVHGIRFESRGRVVLLERKDGELWGRVERLDPAGAPVIREFPLAAEAKDLFAAFAAPLPLRTVGPLDATTRGRYALEDGTLTVDVAGGKTYTLQVGARVMAGNDRYVGDPRSRTVVILPAAMLDPLDQGERLMLRDLIGLDERQLTRLVVARGDQTREAVREGGAWKVPGGDLDAPYLAGEIARATFRLAPTEYIAQTRAPADLAAAGRVTLAAGAAPPVDLDLFRRGDDEFWVRTPLTRGLAKVSSGSARRITDAIAQLLPAAAN